MEYITVFMKTIYTKLVMELIQNSYFISTKDDKKILVNFGVIYSFKKINNFSFFPSISLSYLIDN